ncbi:hypothetical protein BaRGS_00011838 [Batillaria attramentaria]|uniref:HTH CENPB-type domain-containing protein n=1 Tax=Batillaria attramentaria TaxID=370345 RepID=A0ABD0LC44_9CAEN
MDNTTEGVSDGDGSDSDRDSACTLYNTDGGSDQLPHCKSDDNPSDSDNTHFLNKGSPLGDRDHLTGMIHDMIGDIMPKPGTSEGADSTTSDFVERALCEVTGREDGDTSATQRPPSLFEVQSREERAGEGLHSPQMPPAAHRPPSGPFVVGDQMDMMAEAFAGKFLESSLSGSSSSLLLDSSPMHSPPGLDPNSYLSPSLMDKMKWMPRASDQGSAFPSRKSTEFQGLVLRSVPRQQKVRTDLSLSDRVRLINMSETTGKSQRSLAAEFHISVGSVNNILRRKREYLEAFEKKEKQPSSKTFCYSRPGPKPSSFSDIHMLIVRWLEIARMKMKPLSWPIILEKARVFATRLNIPNFTFSEPWLEQLKHSLDIPPPRVQRGIKSESDAKVLTMWQKMLPFLVQGYDPENIFTVTETAVYYKCLPMRCLIGEPVAKLQGSQSHMDMLEHRLTVLLCCNALGERLKPLVISRHARPASLTGVRMTELPVVWCHQSEGVMTTDIFAGWLRSLDAAMGQQRRQIALFMDMTPSHLASVLLKHTSLKFYLDNSAHLLQPLNQGVVRTLKGYYRRRLLQATLARSNTVDSSLQSVQSISELDAIFWIQEAWRSISTETIGACFQAAAFPDSTESTSIERASVSVESLPSDLPLLVQRCSRVFRFAPMSVEVFIEFDSQLPCHHGDTEDWESSLVAEAMGRRIKSEPVDNSAGDISEAGSSHSLPDDERASVSAVSASNALECLSKLKRFSSSNIGLLTTVYELEGLVLDSLHNTQHSLASGSHANLGLAAIPITCD